MRLKIKNWFDFQHYRDRCPPWIKLHFSILTSRDWVSLSDGDRVLAIACMLVASRDSAGDGSFDADGEYIKRVAYLNSDPDFQPLVDNGFLLVVKAGASITERVLADATTETETETEAEADARPRVGKNDLGHLKDLGRLVALALEHWPQWPQVRAELEIQDLRRCNPDIKGTDDWAGIISAARAYHGEDVPSNRLRQAVASQLPHWRREKERQERAGPGGAAPMAPQGLTLKGRLNRLAADVVADVKITPSRVAALLAEAVEDRVPIPVEVIRWVERCAEGGAFELLPNRKIAAWNVPDEPTYPTSLERNVDQEETPEQIRALIEQSPIAARGDA